MKKTKILMPILGVTATLGAVVPTIVACNKDQDKTIDDSAVVKQVNSNDLGDGNIGFTFEGFKYGNGIDIDNLKAYAVSDAEYWSGSIVCEIKKSKSGQTFDVSMVLTAGADAGLANYQITLKFGYGEGTEFQEIYSSDEFYGFNKALVIEPTVDKPEAELEEYSYLSWGYRARFTGFTLTGYQEMGLLDNAVAYLYYAEAGEGHEAGERVPDANYTTDFGYTSAGGGACYLDVYMDLPSQTFSRKYLVGIELENIFDDPIVLLDHNSSKQYTITHTA